MPKALDITGQKFGRLTALCKAPSRGGKTYWLCRCDCGNEKEIQTCHLTGEKVQSCGCIRQEIPSLMNQISDTDFINIVKSSFSYAEITRKCGFSNVSGASEKIIKNRIDKLNLSTDHFKKLPKNRQKWLPEDIFIINSPVNQSTLRRYYKEGNYTKYKCSICGQEPFWNGKELTLTLDHINGQNHDDRLENLRWVCPNCDRQLDTFAGKNNKKDT